MEIIEKKMKNFSLMGVGGYIAPKHLEAIKVTNNNLISAFDPNDSVGIMDKFFRDALYFKEFERFDRHIFKLSKNFKEKIDYVSICTPNYLHDSHIRFSLRSGADAICEKPLVLNLRNLEPLSQLEINTGKKIYTILQLRNHNKILRLKNQVSKKSENQIYDIDLTYITSRGSWYNQSWKGDIEKSGGIATNIGVHFFDMLHYLFGKPKHSKLHLNTPTKQSGFLELEKANVRWFLSIDYNDLPNDVKKINKSTFRSIKINEKELEFSEGFEDLHIKSYKQILKGQGFGLKDNYDTIKTISLIRTSRVSPLISDYHPRLKEI